MHHPTKLICTTLCGLTLLIPLSFAQVQTSAPPPLKSVQSQSGPSRSGHPQTPASSNSRLRVSTLKPKAGPLQSGPTVAYPSAALHDAAITAALQRQRQAAEAEAAQMKMGIRPASKPGLPAIPSQPMSAPGSNTSSRTKGPASGNVASGRAGSTSIAGRAVTAIDTTVLTCGHDATMRILNVSGNAAPATFTPDTRYNFYTIRGCSFGDIGPNAEVYIYKGSTFHEKFQIQEWNENWIKLNLDPALTGKMDQDNLTLVVQRADGKQTSKSGFKFYAVRETTHLSHIPQNDFSLNRFTPNDTSHLQDIYNSPSSPQITPGVAGVPGHTAEVYWDCTNCSAIKGRFNNITMTGNEDIYKLDRLQSGFVPAKSGLAYRNLDCTGVGSLHTEGQFGLQWVGSDLHVTWQGQTCVDEGCGGIGQGDCFGSGQSDYVVDVWVIGPRGVDPWTGSPLP